ncbi:carboxypeptidase-like regulatory domain-containing protein [Pedobacter deserti]|uniref:carboxypeptidase-like regulatory domain-containing protein n=1 Tax=Pedobacter deserti TaxID=2817382 RepID=UPI00210E875D|nr:carboxypeptidase-like regulatory domain-containing protein [Pedobacter sp. SYSU D00382]
MKRYLTITFFSVVGLLLAFMPRQDNPAERIAGMLQKWIASNPQEKVHLHTDKPYYAVGDTLWFKGYVTLGAKNEPSKKSGALYVDLINNKDSIMRSLKFPVTSGTTMGDIVLLDEYPAGNYRLRAYTQWMRNAGPEYFFERAVWIGDSFAGFSDTDQREVEASGKRKKRNETLEKTKPTSLSESDVQFFPEGGYMVNGIRSKIAFKAVAPNGRGTPVSGVILDGQTEILRFKSLHAGMGNFMLSPDVGKNYQARIRFADSTEKIVTLPKALPQGYVLSVYQPNPDSLLVRIYASAGSYGSKASPRNVYLVAQSGGEPVASLKVGLTRAMTSVWLKKDDFPNGVAQFSLFNGQYEPLNERLAFIKNSRKMDVDIRSDKRSYQPREKVQLKLSSTDESGSPLAGNFSVSVVDEHRVPHHEENGHTILSDLLLVSDIKGYVEQPNYYFIDKSPEAPQKLDNLMLTQGYRRFDWQELIRAIGNTASPNPSQPKFAAEGLGTEVSGKVLTLTGQPVPNGTVTLMSLRPGFLEVIKTDAAGKFQFNPIMITDSLSFAVQATGKKNTKKVEIILDTVARQKITPGKIKPDFLVQDSSAMETYLQNVRREDEQLVNRGFSGRATRLKEVRIKAKKRQQELTAFTQGPFHIPDGHADQTYKLKDTEGCPTLGDCLKRIVAGVVFQPNKDGTVFNYPHYFEGGALMPMAVFLNGRSLRNDFEISDVLDNNMVAPEDVIKVDVVKRNQALMMVLNSGPALLIYTRPFKKKIYIPNVANIKPKGFNRARFFYSPKYDKPGITNQLADHRSTIYWNPGVRTFGNGTATLSYFNGDGPGTYRVTVEGISAAGDLVHQVYRYEVSGPGPSASRRPVTKASEQSSKIISAFNSNQKRMPGEKLYLHLDKSAYQIGDTMWFKAYLMDNNLMPSKNSGILYVDINSDTGFTARRVSVKLQSGIGYAQIPLNPKIFREGGYTVQAYTNWMQNFGPESFFTQRFYLGKPTRNSWLVNSSVATKTTGDGHSIQADLLLKRFDQSPAGLRDVDVLIMEGDREINKQRLQTAVDGSLQFTYPLKEKYDARSIRAVIKSVHPNDGNQVLKVPLSLQREKYIDLQFLPEGGNLVAGHSSTVAFKALAEDGYGIHAEGEICDSLGRVVTTFKSFYNGMGKFSFTPAPGHKYTARLMQSGRIIKTFPLPEVKASGSILKVWNPLAGDSIRVFARISPAQGQSPDKFTLIATSGATVTFVQDILLADSLSVNLHKDLFPTGITRIALLRNEQPVNERLIFIDHRDALQIALNTDRQSYAKRGSVSIGIEVKDSYGKPVSGELSVSVTDDSQIHGDTMGNDAITTRLLLQANLKGHIETPGFYMYGAGKDRWEALDNLMLTQGWTGYRWETEEQAPAQPAYLAEKELKVAGMVTNLFKKPVVGARMLVSSQNPAFIAETVTDTAGRYVIENLPPIDSGAFFIQARTPKGTSMNFGEVSVEQSFKPAPSLLNYQNQIAPWYVNADAARLNQVKYLTLNEPEFKFQGGITLREVAVKKVKRRPGSFNAFPKDTDYWFTDSDIKESTTTDLYEFLMQKLPGSRLVNDYSKKGRGGIVAFKWNGFTTIPTADIYIDGESLAKVMQIRNVTSISEVTEGLRSIKAVSLKAVEVARGYAVKRRESVGTLYLQTKSGRGWYRVSEPDIAHYRPVPTVRPQAFYSPKYTVTQTSAADNDFQSTIYWKPDITTDSEGKSRISFYTSDVTGSYTLNIQGTDMNGHFGSTTMKIKVGQASDAGAKSASKL